MLLDSDSLQSFSSEEIYIQIPTDQHFPSGSESACQILNNRERKRHELIQRSSAAALCLTVTLFSFLITWTDSSNLRINCKMPPLRDIKGKMRKTWRKSRKEMNLCQVGSSTATYRFMRQKVSQDEQRNIDVVFSKKRMRETAHAEGGKFLLSLPHDSRDFYLGAICRNFSP